MEEWDERELFRAICKERGSSHQLRLMQAVSVYVSSPRCDQQENNGADRVI